MSWGEVERDENWTICPARSRVLDRGWKREPMRLYRGLKTPYRSELVGARESFPTGTDFSDCPYTALLYAKGRRSEFIVLDVPDDARTPVVTEEDWLGPKTGRFMVWGKFDDCITAIIPAKELRAQVRRKGIATAPDETKSEILRRCIEERIRRDRCERGPERSAPRPNRA